MSTPISLLVVNDEKSAIDCLLDQAPQLQTMTLANQDIVVLRLSSDAMSNLLERLQRRGQGIYRISDTLTMDVVRRRVTRTDKLIHLTPTEYQLLQLLAQNLGAAVHYHDLMQAITTRSHSEHLLHTHISNLRRKIEPVPTKPRHIMTVSNIGYRLVSTVS